MPIEHTYPEQPNRCRYCNRNFSSNIRLINGLCQNCYRIIQNYEIMRQNRKQSKFMNLISILILMLTFLVGFNQIAKVINDLFQELNILLNGFVGFLNTIDPILIIGLVVLIFIFFMGSNKRY